MGDWYEEMASELERLDAWENAPGPDPLTEAEIEDWSTCKGCGGPLDPWGVEFCSTFCEAEHRGII